MNSSLGRPLADFITLTKDGEWGKSEPFGDSVQMRIIRGTDFDAIREGDWSGVPTRHVSRRHAELKSLVDNDILIETAGGSRDRPTGRTLFLKPGTIATQALPVTCASFARFIRLDPSAVEPDFVYWWLQHLYETRQLFAFHTQHTGVARFQWTVCSHSIRVPSLDRPQQRKIATILSAYEDLMENNYRRIRLLEEMARRIYQEWFVDFRYPGHEQIPLIDSELGPIPKGWSAQRMDGVADVIDCLHSKKPNSTDSGTGILLQLFNVGSGGMIDLSETYRISAADYEQWTSRIELRAGDCVVTNVGRIAAVAQIPPGLKAAPGRNMTALRPRMVAPTYLIQYLLSDHMDHEVQKKKDAGSIMDSLNVKGIVKLAVPVPPDDLATRFERLVRPVRREMELLVTEEQNIRAARDLLLPRLISGKIDVSKLAIATPAAVA